MKAIIAPMFFVIAILFASCTKDDISTDKTTAKETPVEEPVQTDSIAYFSFNAHPNFYSVEHDHWIIIHNQKGELLDYKPYEAGDSLVFKATKDSLAKTDNLSITTLNYAVNVVNNLHQIRTYTGIEKGDTWNIGGMNFQSQSVDVQNKLSQTKNSPSQNLVNKTSSNYNIIVNNVPGVEKYTLSSREYNTTAQNHLYQDTSMLSINDVELFSGIQYLLSIGDGEGQLKYAFLEISDIGEDISLDYGDFSFYDGVVEVELPQHHHLLALVFGYENASYPSGALLLNSEHNLRPQTTKFQMGYLNRYSYFDTYFDVQLDESYGYGFQQLGEIPNGIDILGRPNFKIHNDSIFAFDFSTDVEYIRRSSTWTSFETMTDNTINQTHWIVHSAPNNTSKIGNLPQELAQKYPFVNVDKLVHSRTTLTLKSYSYNDMIDQIFKFKERTALIYEWIYFRGTEN